jgi:integrase
MKKSIPAGVSIRPHKTNDGREAWRVVLSVGGRKNRTRPSAVVFGDYDKAVQKALDLRAAKRRTPSGERARQTVSAFLLEEWLPRRSQLRATTREGYELIIRTTIEPLPLGSILLDDVEPLDVEAWMTTLRLEGRPDGRGPMSEARLLRCFAVLRAGMRKAVRWQMRTYDPTAGVDIPAPEEANVATPKREDLERIVVAFRDHPLEPAVALAAGGGLRLGETLGLKWGNVDLDGGIVRVRETLRAVAGGLIVLPPKSKNSRRDVNLPGWVVEVLRDARQRQNDAGANVVSGYVVSNGKGGPYHPQEAGRQYRAALARLGMAFTFHSLRHAHASLGLDDGVELSIMSRRLGHSTIYVTDRLYYHPDDAKDRDAAARFDGLITRRA